MGDLFIYKQYDIHVYLYPPTPVLGQGKYFDLLGSKKNFQELIMGMGIYFINAKYSNTNFGVNSLGSTMHDGHSTLY